MCGENIQMYVLKNVLQITPIVVWTVRGSSWLAIEADITDFTDNLYCWWYIFQLRHLNLISTEEEITGGLRRDYDKECTEVLFLWLQQRDITTRNK